MPSASTSWNPLGSPAAGVLTTQQNGVRLAVEVGATGLTAGGNTGVALKGTCGTGTAYKLLAGGRFSGVSWNPTTVGFFKLDIPCPPGEIRLEVSGGNILYAINYAVWTYIA